LAAAAAGISADGPINLDDVTALADSAPVRKLLNMILLLAIKDQASDLHFEPFENEFKIRIKADGEDSRVDIRSASRYFDSDLGSNASRITKLIADINSA